MDFEKYWLHPHPVIKAATGFVASVCLVSSAVAQDSQDSTAGNGIALLDEFTRNVSSLTTSFRQTPHDSSGEPLESEVSTGQFSFLRPDRFRWHEQQPIEQSIIANGEFIWMYDVEFEQVREGLYSSIAGTPAALLSGHSAIADDFLVQELPAEGELRLLSLQPRESNAGTFESAEIYFDDDAPVMLEWIDELGQLTRIEFIDVAVNPEIAASEFEFVAPAGVRIVPLPN